MKARYNYLKGAGTYCIFWGYFIAFLSLLNFTLFHVFANIDISPKYASYVWLATLPVAIIYFIYIKYSSKKEIAKTHIDRVIYSIWLAFAISSFLLIFVLSFYANIFKATSTVFLITPIMLLLIGLAQFASGAALKFKTYYYAACIFWIGSVASIVFLYIFERGDLQFIIMAACMLLGFCIPGHLLNRKAKQNV